MNTSVNQTLFPGDTVLAYLALAGATCLIYDHLTTLDIEIEIIWNRPRWQIPQALFIINRYVGLALQIYIAFFFIKNLLGESTEVRITFSIIPPFSPHSLLLQFLASGVLTEIRVSATFNLISGFLTAVIFFAMHGIMVFRVSSMYTHEPKIRRILISAYVIEFLSVIFIQLIQKMYGANANSIEMFIQASVAFCAKEKNTPWIFVVWIPLVLFEFLIFGLALALGIKYYRAVGERQMFSQYRNSKRKTPLLYILLRDSIIFPCIFSFSCIINLIVCLLTANGLRRVIAHIAALFPVILSVIFGSRLILNLREAYYESYDSEFSIHINTSILSESHDGGSIPFPTQIPLSDLRTPIIDI